MPYFLPFAAHKWTNCNILCVEEPGKFIPRLHTQKTYKKCFIPQTRMPQVREVLWNMYLWSRNKATKPAYPFWRWVWCLPCFSHQEPPLTAVTFQGWWLFCSDVRELPLHPQMYLICSHGLCVLSLLKVVPDLPFLSCRYGVIPKDSASSLQGLECLRTHLPSENWGENKRDGVPQPFPCSLSFSPSLHWAESPHSC